LLSFEHFLCNVGVGSLKSEDNWLGESYLLGSVQYRLGENVALEDSSKNIDEDSFNLLVVVQELDGLGHLLSVGATTNIKKVGWLSSVQFDNIHGGHGKTGSIDEAADVSSDMNVVEVVFLSMHLSWVLLGLVLSISVMLLSIACIVVDGDL